MGHELLQAGVGGRPILLVHGYCGAKEDFADAVPLLAAAGWHAVAPDLRGHGAGPHPAGRSAYSLAAFADDVLGVADGLGWGRFVLLGHSMGGMVAQVVALSSPGRLGGLVLMNTGHGPVDIDPDAAAAGRALVAEGGMPALLAAMKVRGDVGPPAHLRLLAECPAYGEFNDRKLLACSPDMWTAMLDELGGHDDRLAALAGVDVPTLVVVGEQDDVFLGPSKVMADVMPNARLVVLADAGHAPQFEQPEAWWRALAAFLEEID